ncbi:sensor domain-containing diguanylate cyclase [Chitinimonas koreensis]|uniref:sensor domain-containing diguanylate cyclase n=1 Tax=Chitinimonas koreensis TaxID=356302 RepID=UPI00040FFD01|nr:sensor domain-containing diguanylate cyclase [Chitinimonas koreensis]
MDHTLERIGRVIRRHPRRAIALFARAEESAREAGALACQLDALYQRYFTLEYLGEEGGIADALYHGLQLAEQHGMARQAGRMLEAIGRLRYARGEYREAAQFWARCLDTCALSGDLHAGIEARIGLGQIYDAMGDSATAARFHRDAGELADRLDEPYLASKVAINRGYNLRSIGEAGQAAEQFRLALAAARRGGIKEYVAESHWHLGALALDQGDLVQAEQETRTALALAEASGYGWLRGGAFRTLADILLKQRRFDDASEVYRRALEHARQVGSRRQQADCHEALSALAEGRGDYREALGHARQHAALQAVLLEQLVVAERLPELQQYDLSQKPPIEQLLDLSTDALPLDASAAGAALEPALERVVRASLGILRIEFVAIWLRERAGADVVCCSVAGPPGLPLAPGRVLAAAELPLYHRLHAQVSDPLVVHDARLHPAAAELPALFGPAGVRSLLEVPLRVRGDDLGFVSFGQLGGQRNWTRDDVLFGTHLASLVERILGQLEHVAIQQALERSNEALELRVAQRTRELELANLALEEASLTDPLTGLRNRRFLLRYLDADVALSVRRHEDRATRLVDADLLFFLVDIDHFKAVNDHWGHAAGDQVLVQLCERLRLVVREADYLVRWGGEEFLVVARESNRDKAAVLAERIRLAVAERAFKLEDGTSLAMSCSIGFACFPFAPTRPAQASWPQVVDLADQALYLAKHGGRNAWFGLVGARPARPALPDGQGALRAAVLRGDLNVATSLAPAAVEAAWAALG